MWEHLFPFAAQFVLLFLLLFTSMALLQTPSFHYFKLQEGGAGVCKHCYSWARGTEMLALDATQLGAFRGPSGKTIKETTLTFATPSNWE